MISVVTMLKFYRLMFVLLLIPTAVSFVGCDDDQPRVVEETDDLTFEDMAKMAADETERSEAERAEAEGY